MRDTSSSPPLSLILTLALLAALGTLATNIILPSFAFIAKSFNLSDAALNPILSVFFFSFAFSQLIVGPLADWLGRSKVLVTGLIVFIIGSLICAVSTNLSELVVGRAIQALGVSAGSVLARAIARDIFEGAKLARVMTIIMVVMAAAPGFSPLIGGGVTHFLGWRYVFATIALSGVVGIGLYLVYVGETLKVEQRVTDSPQRIATQYIQLLFNREFALPALASSLLMGGLFAFFGSLPSVLMTQHHLSSFQLGLFCAGTVLIVFTAGFLAPKLVARLSIERVSALGLFIATFGGLCLLAGYLLNAENMISYTLSICIFLFGMGLANPLITAITLTPFGKNAGQASALLGFLQMFFAAIGIMMMSIVISTPSFTLSLVLIGYSLIASLLFNLRKKPS